MRRDEGVDAEGSIQRSGVSWPVLDWYPNLCEASFALEHSAARSGEGASAAVLNVAQKVRIDCDASSKTGVWSITTLEPSESGAAVASSTRYTFDLEVVLACIGNWLAALGSVARRRPPRTGLRPPRMGLRMPSRVLPRSGETMSMTPKTAPRRVSISPRRSMSMLS